MAHFFAKKRSAKHQPLWLVLSASRYERHIEIWMKYARVYEMRYARLKSRLLRQASSEP